MSIDKLLNYFDDYELKARFAPCLVPIVMNIIYIGTHYWNSNSTTEVKSELCMIIGFVIISLLIIKTNISRWVSISIVQKQLYGKRNLDFPSTTILLRNDIFSTRKKDEICRKIKLKYNIKLNLKKVSYTQQDKINIKEVIAKIVDDTRNDKILRDFNIAYGSSRNLTGALIVNLPILTLTLLYVEDNPGIKVSFAIIYIIFIILSYNMTKFYGEKYAIRLYDAFLKP